MDEFDSTLIGGALCGGDFSVLGDVQRGATVASSVGVWGLLRGGVGGPHGRVAA
jgi:septum formation inhibitor MinC